MVEAASPSTVILPWPLLSTSIVGVVSLSFPPVATTRAVVAPGIVNVTIAEQTLFGFAVTFTMSVSDVPPDDEVLALDWGSVVLPHAAASAARPTQAIPSKGERTILIILSIILSGSLGVPRPTEVLPKSSSAVGQTGLSRRGTHA